MATRTVITAFVIALAAPLLAGAQAPPDFSGRWSAETPAPTPSARDAAAELGRPAARSVELGSGWGRTITITQDARTLTVQWPIFTSYDMQPPLTFAYALDGSERVNAVMMGRGVQRQRSTALWTERSLVIRTTYSFTDPSTGRDLPAEVRQTLTLASPTSLVVETVRGPALGGPPSTTRTVYTKGGGT